MNQPHETREVVTRLRHDVETHFRIPEPERRDRDPWMDLHLRDVAALLDAYENDTDAWLKTVPRHER